MGVRGVLALVAVVALTGSVCGETSCGDGVVSPPEEECDDGNTIDKDGCSSLCKEQPIAVHQWHYSDDCTGPIAQTIVFMQREYQMPGPGYCSSIGDICQCLTEDPTCLHGSDPVQCRCVRPECKQLLGACTIYKDPNSLSHQTLSYSTVCMEGFPEVTTVSPLSPTGTFLIKKEWRLTYSSAKAGNQPADIQAWEPTRMRALAAGDADVWKVTAGGRCLPSWNNLLLTDKARPKFIYERHDYAKELSWYGCSDDTCNNCTKAARPMARDICLEGLTCQILAPGRCLVCTGGLAGDDVPGFKTWAGPPSPNPYYCQPCSNAPDNYFVQRTNCVTGQGCGECGPGEACGACGEQGAPAPACGDQRLGGRPFFWISAYDQEEAWEKMSEAEEM